jgi:hypothetical protein
MNLGSQRTRDKRRMEGRKEGRSVKEVTTARNQYKDNKRQKKYK